jgi:hypothetical protein
VPGCGDETTLDDWIGGLEAWRALMTIVGAARRQDPDLANRLESWMAGKGPMPDILFDGLD